MYESQKHLIKSPGDTSQHRRTFDHICGGEAW